MKRNTPGAVAILIGGAAALFIGLNALLHIDRYGDHVMRPDEICANHSDHAGSWANNYGQQRARNQHLGIGMLGGSGVSVVAAGLVYAFTSPDRRPSRREAISAHDLSRQVPAGV